MGLMGMERSRTVLFRQMISSARTGQRSGNSAITPGRAFGSDRLGHEKVENRQIALDAADLQQIQPDQFGHKPLIFRHSGPGRGVSANRPTWPKHRD